ncbi:thiosulfate/3-mercaptopyruvate sulfurtransferase [Desulfotomaculum arcticum]|uniref:thiosulfate sulfurtransferase n=1 Tax=Desulfotruncus arcticus DSM 17038 TaxID=1121424 RepID=A0A1I2VQA0_9FIRM|nr:rhodanese-like domain-containing protein [Desulfotruncus arcticus]SFG89656.1 thiosulfate/3-mercaptopyruvate sulfurtransferase [Desulfotomaculum arcticum] [Desulfotruncus arcticus DSM 17038]
MSVKKYLVLGVLLTLLAGLLIGCGNKDQDLNTVNAKEPAVPYTHPEAMISADQLKKILSQPNLTILDTRTRDIYEQGHIPGAICFNVKSLMDPNRRGRFTSPKLFSLTIREYGVNSSDHIVVYSDNYNHAALWFFLNMYGLNVQMLNGGLEQWLAKGYEMETGRVRRGNLGAFNLAGEQQKANFIIETATLAEALLQNSEGIAVIDARSAEEFSGRGHIPGAINITWDQLINEDMTFKNASDLKELFTDNGITPEKQVVIYSNNSIRASYIHFVLNRLLGYANVKIYDGFYLYWAREKTIVKGSV